MSPPRGAGAPVTAEQAREHLLTVGRALRPGDFDQLVLLVTADHALWCSAAKYQKLGPYHLVWTEHHGYHVEHEDEVAKLHVVRLTRADQLADE